MSGMATTSLLDRAVAVLEHSWWTEPPSTIFLWGVCSDTAWLRGVLPGAPNSDPHCPWHAWRTGQGDALAIPMTTGMATTLFLAIMGNSGAGHMAGFVLDKHRRRRLLVGNTTWGRGWTAVDSEGESVRIKLAHCPDDALALLEGYGRVPFQAFSSGHERLLDTAHLARGHHGGG
jgi:hypothetical protein